MATKKKGKSLTALFDALGKQKWPKYVGDASEAIEKLKDGHLDLFWQVADQDVVAAPAVKLFKRVLPIALHADYPHGPTVFLALLRLFEFDWGWAPRGLNRETTATFFEADKTYRHFNAGYKVLLKARPDLVALLGSAEPRRRAVAAMGLALLGEVAADVVEDVRAAWDHETDADAKLAMTLCLGWYARSETNDADRERLFSMFESDDERARYLAAIQLGSLRDERVLPYLLEQALESDPAWGSFPIDFEVGTGPVETLSNEYVADHREKVVGVLQSLVAKGSPVAVSALRELLLPDPSALPDDSEARELVIAVLTIPRLARQLDRFGFPPRAVLEEWLGDEPRILPIDERPFQVGSVEKTLLDFAKSGDESVFRELVERFPDYGFIQCRDVEVLRAFAPHVEVTKAVARGVQDILVAHAGRGKLAVFRPERFNKWIIALHAVHGEPVIAEVVEMASRLVSPDAPTWAREPAVAKGLFIHMLCALRDVSAPVTEQIATRVEQVWGENPSSTTRSAIGQHYPAVVPDDLCAWLGEDVMSRVVGKQMRANPIGAPFLGFRQFPSESLLEIALSNLDRALEEIEPAPPNKGEYAAWELDGFVSVGPRLVVFGSIQAPLADTWLEQITAALSERLTGQKAVTRPAARKALLAALTKLFEPGRKALESLRMKNEDDFRLRCLERMERHATN